MPDVGTSPVIPDPAFPAAPQGTLPGTQIPIPRGTGVEGLTVITAPFRTNGPAWYTPEDTIWSAMGCAVGQAGRYIQTNNEIIYETVNEMGKALFEVMWKYPDRKLDRSPSRSCLLEIYNMLIDGRKRMANNAIASNEQPPLPAKYVSTPQMFLAYPVPLYGPLGCTNLWMRRMAIMVLCSITEAMQHQDNILAFHTTKDFFNTVWMPLHFLLGDMAWRFFSIARPKPEDVAFVIPLDAWSKYDDQSTGQANLMTSTRPPLGYEPTNLDLEVIRGLPYSQIVGFLQPWPASNLLYSSGGIWGTTSVPDTGIGSGGEVSGNPRSQSAYSVNPSLAPNFGLPKA